MSTHAGRSLGTRTESERESEPAPPISTATMPTTAMSTATVPLAGLAVPSGHRLARATAGQQDPLGGAPIPAEVLSALRRRAGTGQRLPAEVSEPVGAELGHDLSGVRVHADAEADRIARSVQSVAFSYGSDLYFTAGTYRPRESGGQHLLAHELAHVAQASSGPAGTVGSAADPAEAAADRTADRVVTALRRRAVSMPQPAAAGDRPDVVSRLHRQHARRQDALRRTIIFRPDHKQPYARDRTGLEARLMKKFPAIDPAVIRDRVDEVIGLEDEWRPYEAYGGIKDWILLNFAPAPTKVSGRSTISKQEAHDYFVSSFKTFAEVIVDDTKAFKFTNDTAEEMHAEDKFIAAMDKYVEQQRWHQNFRGSHALLIRINNSPCIRCAKSLYHWKYRDLFSQFTIQFANAYDKRGNFTQATRRLRSGGVTMDLYSVTANLEGLLNEGDFAKRKKKDAREAFDWDTWQKEHAASLGGAGPAVMNDDE
ncbi:MAG: DUF4157 domain-containing protein [Jatrophihabitantaceae bacterium]